MNTPILSEVQQKKCLSAKKRSKKLTIKNILSTPYSNYWPVLDEQDASSLNEVLDEHLLEIKPPKVAIPWNELQTVAHEQRKAFRLNYQKDTLKPHPHSTNNKGSLVFGINEVTKLLEAGTASSVLVSSDVNPQFMVKHVLDMAVSKSTSIVLVPDLKNLLKQKTGISSLAIAFKSSGLDSNYLLIDQKIKEICLKYPVPSKHLNYLRSKHVMKSHSTMDLNESSDEVELCRDLYLYRKTKCDRVFVPEASRERVVPKSITKMEVDDSGFLGFNDADDDVIEKPVVKKQKTKISYKSLVVKRVTNNKDRGKKKIEMLKAKR